MLETVSWLALTVPFIAAVSIYITLQEKRWPRVLAGLVAVCILAAILVGYFYLYRSLSFPPWMRWLSPAAHSEPLPGNPEVQINTELDGHWTIVGMNYDWMVLVAKAHLQIGQNPEAFMRWEYAKPQDAGNGNLYLSEVQQIELDCAAKRWNPLVVLSYAQNNLSGVEVYSGRGDPRNPLWDTPDPKSIAGAAVRAACELFGG